MTYNKEKKAKYDTKADVWSFGIFAVELLTKYPPFYVVREESALFKAILD